MLEHEWIHDFRREAIETSLALVRSRTPRYPYDARVSVCLPTENSQKALRGATLVILGMFGLAFLLCAVSACLFYVRESMADADRSPLLLPVAMSCGVLGVLLLFIPNKFGGHVCKPFLRTGLDELKRNPQITNITYVTGIERAETFSSLKVFGEDIGYIAHDPTNRRIILLGILCTYIIHHEDVLLLQPKQEMGSPGTRIRYLVGGKAMMDIVVEQVAFVDEAKKFGNEVKTHGFEKIRHTLGFDGPVGDPSPLKLKAQRRF